MFDASRARSQRSRSSRSRASIIDWSSARCWGVIERSSDCIAAIRWVSCSTMSSSVRAPGKNRPCSREEVVDLVLARLAARRAALRGASSGRGPSRGLPGAPRASSPGSPPTGPSTNRSSVCLRSRSVRAWKRSLRRGLHEVVFLERPDPAADVPWQRLELVEPACRRVAEHRVERSGRLAAPSGGVAASSSRRSIPARSSATMSSSSWRTSARTSGAGSAPGACSRRRRRRSRRSFSPAQVGPGRIVGRASRAPSAGGGPRRDRPRP